MSSANNNNNNTANAANPTKGANVVSLDGPTPQERQHSLTLGMWCDNTVEPEEECDRRRNAVVLLQSVCKQWIHKTYVDEFNLPANDDVGGRIFATGSYRYAAHSSGSDIDVVLIAPERLTIEHFKSRLPLVLKALPQVTDIVVIGEARVPLISMKIFGIDFDLSFGNLCRPRIPEGEGLNMLDDNILVGLSQQSVRAANAVRVALLLIRAVPDVAVFRNVLRFVKAWAKSRGVYSFKIGFPSGIGWAILCARICQCYPNKNDAGTVFLFFAFYASWFRRNPTPDRPNRSIYLTSSHLPPVDLRRMGVEQPSWNPQERIKEARALFPVLTPANPYQDSCDNVSMTTLGVLCDEFQRANEVVKKLRDSTLEQIPGLQKSLHKALENKREIERDNSSVPGEAYEKGKEAMAGVTFGDLWEALMQRFPFFTSYGHYIRITLAASNPREYRPWVDMTEAKLCSLWKKNPKVATLEDYAPNLRIRPHCTSFEDPAQQVLLDQAKRELQQAEAVGNQQRINEIIRERVYSAHFYIGATLVAGTKIDFPACINTFLSRCTDSQARFPSVKTPVVEIVKRSDLPRWLPGVLPEEEILRREEQEREQQQQQQKIQAETAESALAQAGVVGEGGVIRQRENEDSVLSEEEKKQIELRRQKFAQEEKSKKEAEEKRAQFELELKQREEERNRQLREQQQKQQQTEVESLMGFDF